MSYLKCKMGENKLYDDYSRDDLIKLIIVRETKIINQKIALASLQRTYETLKESIDKGKPIYETRIGIEPNTRCFIKTSYKTFDGIVTQEMENHLKVEINDKEGTFFYLLKKSSIIALKTYYKKIEDIEKND